MARVTASKMIHPAKYLIDTHALHWHWANPGKLPRKVRDIFARANCGEASLIVSHNKIYEINVLRNELTDISVKKFPPFICTLEWSRKILGSKVPNHQLATLCDYFGIELTHAHEAISDARATAKLFAELKL